VRDKLKHQGQLELEDFREFYDNVNGREIQLQISAPLTVLFDIEVPTPVDHEFKKKNQLARLLLEPIPVSNSARARLQENRTLVENMAKHTGFAGSHNWNSRNISTKYGTIQTTGRPVVIPFFCQPGQGYRAVWGGSPTDGGFSSVEVGVQYAKRI